MEFETFHPTFLYEALWNVFVTVPVILYCERHFELRKGASFPIYMIVYGIIRFLTELLRTDTTFRFLGLSRNAYVSLAAIVGGAVLLYVIQTRGTPREPAAAAESLDG